MGKSTACLFGAIVILWCCISHVTSDASDHRYNKGDSVPFYANKVGPFHNPSETYRYFDLPFCSPDKVKEKKEDLGEVLNGDRLVVAPYELDFQIDREPQSICKKTLTVNEVAKFRHAVLKDYFYQMYYDDLPIWGFLGKFDSEDKDDPTGVRVHLFKHVHFEILYNKDRIIDVFIRNDPRAVVDLTQNREVNVDFTYSAKWIETDTPFEKRLEKYSQTSSLSHNLEIHWFSVINSCVTVLLLTGFLAIILMRVLKNDFVKFTPDEEAVDDQEESGWKYIHGDVFRYPRFKSWFAAALGTGTQLFTLAIFIFMLALVGVFYPYNRGSLFTALVIIYALTSGIAGYYAASFYYMVEGKNWYWEGLLARIAKQGSKLLAVPISFLPFSAIYIELYYIFASVWGHQIYTIYSILFIVFIILLIVTAFVTVALTYFQLATEDHEWWWRSFLCGGSTGLFIYGYCLYYYFARSDMSGFMQTSFFFGYMACICYGFFLMLGTVGFRAALIFVRHIYHSIKCE
ncbi:Transmembrane 9 superfamily member 2 [Vigna angularis]|uniref:Transmembrane 9 superfamily member n=1 Tax=Phaseolus angularis TaxID=3914 RepID=A0A8T0K2R0_PHAAN|nr:Transmembrane 9 superfamily member 2 [Vigna angularis]